MSDPIALPHEVAELRALVKRQEALLQEERRALKEHKEALHDALAEVTRMSYLNELSHSLGQTESESELYALTARHAAQIFPEVSRVSIALLTPAGDALVLRTIEKEMPLLPTGTLLTMTDSIMGLAVQQRKLQLLTGEALEKSSLPGITRLRGLGIKTVVAIPLCCGGKVIGTLNMAATRPDFFQPADLALLSSVATLLASQVERVSLVGKLQDSLAETQKHGLELQRELLERTRAEQERATLQEQIINAQRLRLQEMATPMIPITDAVMVMPIIGTVDAVRAEQILSTGLEEVQRRGLRTVIIDVTGMQRVDDSAIGFLAKSANALRLLGARSVITGVRPDVALALVDRRLDLSSLKTCDTLQSAIAAALAVGKPQSSS